MGVEMDRFGTGAGAVFEEDCSMNDLDRRIELEALVTEREKMVAHDAFCSASILDGQYTDEQYDALAIRIRALLTAEPTDTVPAETHHCTCSHTQELQAEVDRLSKDADDWASAAGAAERCLDTCRRDSDILKQMCSEWRGWARATLALPDDETRTPDELRSALTLALCGEQERAAGFEHIRRQRDALAVENTDLRAERDSTREEMGRVQNECDNLRFEWMQIRKERDNARAELSAAQRGGGSTTLADPDVGPHSSFRAGGAT
jgi:FtsZ-binding cell division protein ZapB